MNAPALSPPAARAHVATPRSGLDTPVSFGGVTLRIRYDRLDLALRARRLGELFDQFVTPDDSSVEFALMVRQRGSRLRITEENGSGRSWVCPTRMALVPFLEWLVHKVIAERLIGTVGVHAGVVGPGGRPILLAGESGAGKSTLVLELLQQGWYYWSDDLAVICLDSGLCLPYPKPIKLEGVWRPLSVGTRGSVLRFRLGNREYRYLRPWRTPGFRWGVPAPVAAVVVLGGRGSKAPALVPLSAGQILEALATHASLDRARLAEGFETLCRLAERVPGVRLDMGWDAAGNARLIRQFAEATA